MANVKTFREILSSMVDWTSSNSTKITNFHVGGVVRTLFESVSLEIEALYYQMQKGFKKATKDSIYESFGYNKLPPVASSGNVLFTFKFPLVAPLILPPGYLISSIPVNDKILYFKTTQQVFISTGVSSALVSVTCTEPGELGNVPANTIKIPVARLTEVSDVTNPLPFVGGREQESDEDRKKRFSRFIESLSKGTVPAIEYGCLAVPEVTGVSIDDQIGVVKAYVHNAAGDLPDSVRLDVQNSLINYRSAGIEVLVLPVIKREVDLTISLTLEEGFDPNVYNLVVESEVERFLNSFPVSKSLTMADLIWFIIDVDPAAISNTSTNLTADVLVAKSEIVRPGVITVTTVT